MSRICLTSTVHRRGRTPMVFVVLLVTPLARLDARPSVVTGLEADYRNGQDFLTWKEMETPEGTTFNVYLHDEPITSGEIDRARRIGHHVERRSARDWWKDLSSVYPEEEPGKPEGFLIRSGGRPLDPSGGLFVHTVTTEDTGKRFYAVTLTTPDGREDRSVVPGESALEKGVTGKVELPLAIWIDPDSPPPPRDAARGKPLTLLLHGRGGAHAAVKRPRAFNALAFGDAKQGWREGLAYKFHVAIDDAGVTVRAYDLAWVGREVRESIDPWYRTRAVVSWWYGYNERIYETIDNERKVCPNYTEERLLWMVRWATEYLGTDPERTYVRGGSMGGSGAVSLALHHPEVFAAVKADVPIVAYTRAGQRGSLWRLECIMGKLDGSAVNQDGVPILEHLNGTTLVKRASGDLPPFFITHGRNDGSIPWENNPAFYRALLDARQSLAVYWSDGGHGMHRQAPADVKEWNQRIYRYRRDESYLVFTHSSDNRDPGNGERTDGDPVGWINRGLDWKDLSDTASEYAFTVTAAHADLTGEVRVDITPRRVQRFTLEPGARLGVTVGGQGARTNQVDAMGLFTIRDVRIRPQNGTRVQVLRAE